MTRIFLWIVLALAFSIAVVTLGPVSIRPMTGAPPDVERGVAYLLFGAAISLVCSEAPHSAGRYSGGRSVCGASRGGPEFCTDPAGQLCTIFSVKALALILGAVAMWVSRRLYRRPNR